MSSIYQEIRAALDNRLKTTTDIPDIAFENVPYNATTGTNFVRARMVPTTRRPSVRGSSPIQRYQGIYSVLVCTAEGTGSGANLDIVDSIVDRFEATTDITFGSETVTIEYVDVGNGYIDTPFYCIPINIGWYVYN